MSETIGLPERLRTAPVAVEGGMFNNARLLGDAAAEIERLTARIAELEADRDRTARNRDMWKGQCERQAERLSAINALPNECVEALTYQRQIDMDGCECGVSRQAVDEIYAALKLARAASQDKGNES